MAEPDPTPWRHVGGERVADPAAPGSPTGGYTFAPRHGYSDHGERFNPDRYPDRCPDCREETRRG